MNKEITLYDLARISDNSLDLDIGDNVFDWGEYIGFELGAEDDAFNEAMILFSKRVNVIKLQPEWYTICDVYFFIIKNRRKLDLFAQRIYVEEFAKQFPKADPESEDFYDTYYNMLSDFIRGNLSDEEYKTFCEIFKGE